MGKRKVGDTPFDLVSFFEVLDSLEGKQGSHEPDENFRNHFLPVLKDWSTTTIGRPENKRHHLAKVVGDACHQVWRKLTDKPYPFTDIKWRSKGDSALTSEQNRILSTRTFMVPDELIDYLRSVDQMPQAHIPLVRPSKKKPVPNSAYSTQLLRNSAELTQVPLPPLRPQALQPRQATTESRITHDHKEHALRTQTQGQLKVETPSSHMVPIEKLDLASDAGGTPSPQSSVESNIVGWHADTAAQTELSQLQEAELASLKKDRDSLHQRSHAPQDEDSLFSSADLYHWAKPVPGKPGHFIEAPKIPGCGPWEVPLPRNMDPMVHFMPDCRQVQLLLGNVPLKWNQQTWSISLLKNAALDAQELETDLDSFEVKYILSIRWKAFRVILDWIFHLKDHARPLSTPPMGILDFVQAQLIRDGNTARDSTIKHIEGISGRPVFPISKEYRMPTLQSTKRKQASHTTVGGEILPGPETHDLPPPRDSGARPRLKEASPLARPVSKDNRSSRTLSDTTMNTLRNFQTPKVRSHQRKRRRIMNPFDSDEENQESEGSNSIRQKSQEMRGLYLSTPRRLPETDVGVKEEPMELELRLQKEHEELEERRNPWYLDGSRE